MRTTKQKLHKKLVIIIVSLLVLAAGIFAYYRLYTVDSTTNNSINYNTPSQEETSMGNSIKDSSQAAVESNQAPSPIPSGGGSLLSVGMEVTAANQNGDTLYIRTLIQTVTSSGTCTLIMSGPGSYATNSGVQALPSTSTCTGFNVPISSLSAGTWTISVSFTNGVVRASTSKEVSVQ